MVRFKEKRYYLNTFHCSLFSLGLTVNNNMIHFTWTRKEWYITRQFSSFKVGVQRVTFYMFLLCPAIKSSKSNMNAIIKNMEFKLNNCITKLWKSTWNNKGNCTLYFSLQGGLLCFVFRICSLLLVGERGFIFSSPIN